METDGANRIRIRRRVQSLDDLVEAADVDRKIWDLSEPTIKSWEGFAKDGDGEIQIATLFSVAVDLVRKTPLVISPVVQPVALRRLRRPYRHLGRPIRNLRSALLLFDPHFGFRRQADGYLDPFHDRDALSIALQIAIVERPDAIVWAGDLLDATEWSDKFVVTPDFYQTTQPAVVEASWWIDIFDRFAKPAHHIVMAGNHDERIDRAMNVHLRAAYQLKPADEIDLPAPFTLERLLGLKGMDVQVVEDYPDGEFYLTPDLRVVHGDVVSGTAGGTVAKLVGKSDVSTVFGHIHRREAATRTVYRRDGSRIIEAWSPGCLCRVDGAVPGRTKRQNWQQGAAMVYFDEAGLFQVVMIPIDKGIGIHHGTRFKAKDHREDIRTAVDWDRLFGSGSLG